MPVICAVLFIVAALAHLACFACALPIAVISAFVIYGLGMPVAYLAGLAQVLVVQPAGPPSPGRRLKLPADADPAVPQYFHGPAVVDADHAVRVACGNCRKLWQQGARAVLAAFSTDTVLLAQATTRWVAERGKMERGKMESWVSRRMAPRWAGHGSGWPCPAVGSGPWSLFRPMTARPSCSRMRPGWRGCGPPAGAAGPASAPAGPAGARNASPR